MDARAIMKTIDITLSIDVALSKTLLALMIKNIEIPNAKPKAGIRYRFRPISNPSIETSFKR